MSHSHSAREYPGQLMGVAVLAAGAGALAALLYTPKRGAEMRRDLQKRLHSGRNQASKMLKMEKEMAEDGTQRMAKTAQRTADRAKSTATKVKEDAKDTTKEVKQESKANADRARSMAEEMRQDNKSK